MKDVAPASEEWHALSPSERRWRYMAYRLRRDALVAPACRAVTDPKVIEVSDLRAPWTPNLLDALARVDGIVSHYKHHVEDGFPVFDETQAMFEREELREWASHVEGERRKFRRRVRWVQSEATALWKPFQIDLNSPSLFLDVTGPDVWQVIVDETRDERPDHWKLFLGEMRMASVDYILREIPGAHHDANRKHDPGIPLGYGTRVDMPSFGYRREHLSDTLFIGWARAVMPTLDLFDDTLWTDKES